MPRRVFGVRSRAGMRPLKRAGFEEKEEAFEQARSIGDGVFSPSMSSLSGKAPTTAPISAAKATSTASGGGANGR
jgi:hypothetical protein